MTRLRIFPVVHVQGLRQAEDQSALALTAGADGIFLIDHGVVGTAGLIEAYECVRAAFPGAFVGLNLLNGGPKYAYQALALAEADGALTTPPDAVWVDDTRGGGDLTYLDELPALRGGDRPLLYGGVAFKYTPTSTDDPVSAVAELKDLLPFTDVPTTSGAGTGQAPAPAKLRAMKEALGGRRLAVASGIAADNLADYLGAVDDVLVASSIETEPYSGEFDPEALAEMVDAVHSAQA
jgi:hypothetical protein